MLSHEQCSHMLDKSVNTCITEIACRITHFLETKNAFWCHEKVVGISDGRDIWDSIVTRNWAAGVELLIYMTVTSCTQS